MPTSCEQDLRVLLDERQALLADSTSNGASVRVRNGTVSTCAAARAPGAMRASRPPLAAAGGLAGHRASSAGWTGAGRLAGRSAGSARSRAVVVRGRPGAGVARPRRPAATATGGAGSATARRAAGTARSVRDAQRPHELLLESRLDRGLDLVDASGPRARSRPARAAGQQRHQRARARRVADRLHVGEVAVGDQAQDHGVERVDLAAERAREAHLIHGVHAQVVHQQPRARVQRGLGQLDRPHVVLGDRDARRALVEDIRERAPVGARCAAMRAAARRR